MTDTQPTVNVRPEPRLDHVMVLLDQAAFHDVAESGFLGERFARVRRKEADSSVAGQYATLGIAGTSTLIELFGSVPAGAPLVGGLVFSFEQAGSSSSARALLDESGEVRYYHDLVRRALPGCDEQQPWYHLISVDLGEASPFVLFLNEVTPQYFESIGAKPTQDSRFQRRDYLDAVLGALPERSRLLRDITGITLTASADRARRIADALAALGYQVAGQGEELVLTGFELTLRLRSGEGAERVTEIELALEPGLLGPDTPAEVRFGQSSVLRIGPDDTARWTFGSA